MKEFYCNICKSKHIFHGTISVREPPFLSKMTKREYSERVYIDERFSNFVVIDRSLILSQAELYIPMRKKGNVPFNEDDDALLWKVWIKFSLSDFIDTLKNAKEQFPVIKGTINHIVPPYRDSKDEKIEFTINLENISQLPLITVLETETELGQDFHNGLNEPKMITWMKTLYHP